MSFLFIYKALRLHQKLGFFSSRKYHTLKLKVVSVWPKFQFFSNVYFVYRQRVDKMSNFYLCEAPVLFWFFALIFRFFCFVLFFGFRSFVDCDLFIQAI